MSSQVTIIYIALFTMQIVSKQRYNIKKRNSVPDETGSLILVCNKVYNTWIMIRGVAIISKVGGGCLVLYLYTFFQLTLV